MAGPDDDTRPLDLRDTDEMLDRVIRARLAKLVDVELDGVDERTAVATIVELDAVLARRQARPVRLTFDTSAIRSELDDISARIERLRTASRLRIVDDEHESDGVPEDG